MSGFHVISLMLVFCGILVLLDERTPPSRATPLSEDDPLPEYQGPARVTLMVIDPYLVHAFWYLDSAKRREDSHGVLRVYETTSETTSYFDVPVSLPAKNWYVQLWTPERSYYAELGLVEEGGGFIRLARSNTIQTPRAWPVAAPPAVAPVEIAPETVAQAPLPLVTAQQDRALPQPDNVLQNRDREGAVLGEAPAPSPSPPIPESEPPRAPEPVDAAKLLRMRLEKIYAALEWTPRAVDAPEPPAPDKTPTPSPLVHPNEPGDLTNLSEEHFSTGVSSKLPKPSA